MVLSDNKDCSCQCNIVVVFEMYSLIGSLVVMRDCEAGALAGTFTHASRFKYGRFRRQTGLPAVQKNCSRVFWSHVRRWVALLSLSATRSLIVNVSTCSIVCCCHEDPTIGATGDPGMVRLP